MTPASDSLHQLVPEDLDSTFSAIDIPACPAMVAEVLAESQKDVPDIRKLAKSMATDVSLSAVAIKLANSPLFRVGPPVANITKALERLGIRNTVCVVVAVALRSAMAGVAAEFLEKFWSRTAALALAAGLIARRQYGISPDAAYTYALFHDAGIPMMMKRYASYGALIEESRRTGRPIVELEAEQLSCTHPIIGSLLVRNWGLPPMVGQAIRFHHDSDAYALPDATLPGSAVALIAVTHVAEHLADEFDGEANLEVSSDLFAKALAYLGIDADQIEDLRDAMLTARSES